MKPWIPGVLGLLAGCTSNADILPSFPHRMDIPDGSSTVLCPSEASALMMLDEFLVGKGDGYLDAGIYREGLEKTECEDSGGPITIVAILATRRLEEIPEADFAVYRGADASGGPVAGIVDRYLNDRYPRSEIERWIYDHTDERSGYIDMTRSENRGYVCPTPQAARKVISSIPALQEWGSANLAQVDAKNIALKKTGCLVAIDRYRVVGKHEERLIILANDTEEQWTALTATDPAGRSIGLLYDSSEL